jgi:hypothetical protein
MDVVRKQQWKEEYVDMEKFSQCLGRGINIEVKSWLHARAFNPLYAGGWRLRSTNCPSGYLTRSSCPYGKEHAEGTDRMVIDWAMGVTVIVPITIMFILWSSVMIQCNQIITFWKNTVLQSSNKCHFLHWKWRQYVPSKRWNPDTRLHSNITSKTKLRGFSPQANYTDRATAACRRS